MNKKPKTPRSAKSSVAFPPPADSGLHNLVNMIRVPKGRTITWNFTHTSKGSFVSGYTLN